MLAIAGRKHMPLLAPETEDQAKEAKSRSSAFQQQGDDWYSPAINGQNGDPDKFLAAKTSQLKDAGAAEMAQQGAGSLADNAPNANQQSNNQQSTQSDDTDNVGIDWGYDRIDDARDKHAGRIEEYEAMDNRNPLQDHELKHSQNHSKRADRRQSAREGLEESGWDITDYKNYDSHAFGEKKFGAKDAKFLQQQMEAQGMGQKKQDKLMGKYMDHFYDEGNMGQTITHNNKWAEYGSGDHYVGDMEEGAKAGDYDWGKKMSKPEVRYLKQQGFSDEDIYKEMRQYVAYGNDDLEEDTKKYGIGAHRFMGNQGLYDDWGKEEGGGEGDTGGGDNGGGDTGGGDTGGGDTGGGDTGGGDTGGGDNGGGSGGGGTPDSPMSPSYNGSYNVHGNPYSADKPGYYYGTQQQAIDTARYNMISDNAATAHANGLADIETWQQHAHSRQNYYDNIMHELYSSMGLTGFQGGKD